MFRWAVLSHVFRCNIHAVSPGWSHTPLGRLCSGWKGSLFHPKQHTSVAHVPVCTLYCLNLICMQYFCSWTNVRKYECTISALQKANKKRKQNDMLELILPGSVPRSHDFQLPTEASGYSRSPGECFSSPQSVTWGWHSTQGAAPGAPGNCKWSCLHTCLGSSGTAEALCTTSPEWDSALQPMTLSFSLLEELRKCEHTPVHTKYLWVKYYYLHFTDAELTDPFNTSLKTGTHRTN